MPEPGAKPLYDIPYTLYAGIDLLNLQLAAGLRGDFKEGWRLAKILEEERPGDARCAFNRGWYEMMRGDLQKGMELMDLGRTIAVFGSEMLPEGAPPQWNGKDSLAGKTVLLRGEGGFGDEMIHVRFAKDLSARGARVVVSCHKGLMSLFSRVEGVSSVIPHHLIQNTHFDYWVPAMSAARWLGHTFETLPGGPYLTADPVYVEKWKTILAMKQVRLTSKPPLRVGIRWSGNPKFEHEQHRRFPAEPLIELAKTPGVTVYSLQRDGDIRDLPPEVVDLQHELADWEDTAAAMHHLDLVITSCTATAHLAAALGKETWIILPILPYYVWALPGERSPWYDTVRLFRQDVFGDWDATLSRVQEEFKKWSVVPGMTQSTTGVDGQNGIGGAFAFGGITAQTKAPVFNPPSAPKPVASQFQTQPGTVLGSGAGPAPLYIPGMYFAPKPNVTASKIKWKSPSTLHFVAGLPRAGSTALMNLFAQNPRIAPAPISGLCTIFSGIFANWDKGDFHRELPNHEAKRRVLRAILDFYHESERPVAIDKDRMWVVHFARLEEVLERPVKMIIPVRPIPEILTSFETLRRKDPLELTGADDSMGPGSTIETRAQYFAGAGGPMGQAYNAMKDAVTQGYLDRMLFVDYNKLMGAPKAQLKRIYDFLEEPNFEHDFANVDQIAKGDGRVHGYSGLHDIRGEFKRTSKNPREVLGPDVYAQFDQPEPWSQWT